MSAPEKSSVRSSSGSRSSAAAPGSFVEWRFRSSRRASRSGGGTNRTWSNRPGLRKAASTFHGAFRGREQEHVAVAPAEPVHLLQELVDERLEELRLAARARRAQRVELVEEQHGRALLARALEQGVDGLLALAVVLVEHVVDGDGHEARAELAGRGARDERLAAARRPVEQEAAAARASEGLVDLRVLVRGDDAQLDLALHRLESGHVGERHVQVAPVELRRPVVVRHGVAHDGGGPRLGRELVRLAAGFLDEAQLLAQRGVVLAREQALDAHERLRQLTELTQQGDHAPLRRRPRVVERGGRAQRRERVGRTLGALEQLGVVQPQRPVARVALQHLAQGLEDGIAHRGGRMRTQSFTSGVASQV
jgi:hypothetical protein